MSKRGKGHGKRGRGGYGEAGGSGAGSRRPTEKEIAQTGKLRPGTEQITVEPPKSRRR